MVEISGSRFLVTGGASFIGSYVVEALLADGAREVRALDNLSFGGPETLAPVLGDERLQLIRGDVLRADDLVGAVDGVDGIFHTAGLVTRPLGEHPDQGLDVNVRGTVAVLAAARLARVRKLVLSSSISVYGDTTGAGIAEDAPFRHQTFGAVNVLYGGSKVLAEALCRLHLERYGLDYVALRYPTVYGPRQHDRGVNTRFLVEAWRAIERGQRPSVVGDGSQARDYTYVGDVAAANVRAMESDVTGEALNVATGVSTSEAEAVRLLLELAGSDLRPEYGAGDGGMGISSAPELSYDPGKAARLLGWRAEVPLAEGLKRLVESLEPRAETAAR
jgi:UDP-glucose 4-epimerase